MLDVADCIHDNNWQSLLEVATENDSDATEGNIDRMKVMKGSINGLHHMAEQITNVSWRQRQSKKHENPLVLHCSFILDDKIDAAQHYCLFRVFVNVAQGILAQPINRNRKHGVCCTSTWKEKGYDT